MSESIGVLFDRGDLGVLVPLGGMIRHPDNSDRLRVTELVASTNDPFVDLIIGAYTTARKFVLKTSNGFHRGRVSDDSNAVLGILKNGTEVGTLTINGGNAELSIPNIDNLIEFNFNDVLQLKIKSLSNTCYFVSATLMGEFYPYNLSDIEV